ncbi:polysaccharide biosynthesis tyrosine autokinase [Nakamurella sp. PAMC28650]|uniref:polysaccharide biosynthesis tyrosine autokinase n=1 Tax=Nakamurella sp. PAMC28650 TaxID=2762325 RepID=UPI00164D984E|nr:polysaccharide biosynthesis tyrosine autokinase [Nakamurella sp. PAMC28650]QNK80972.1 polysaccharide biosynthesis tyrosine autokinase [Nakamurella sp. PAMC28650]
MNLRGYLRAIRKYWMLVLLLTVLGTLAATGLTLSTDPKYASTVTFFVSSQTSSSQTALQADQFAQRRINSYAGVMVSDRMADLIIKKANLSLTPAEVKSEISATTDVNTVLLTATVIDTSPDRSLAIANAISTELNGVVNGLDNPGSTKTTTFLNAITGPTLNTTPVSPKKTLNIGLGFLVGLALGVSAAIVRELMDVTVRTADVMQTLSKRPVLATVALDAATAKSPVLVRTTVRSPRGEAFRQLRTSLKFIHVDQPLKVVVVSSSVASEGKSLTAANLALVFAEAGQRVLLIEADLRQPRAADYLGLERAVGLSNVLAGELGVDDVLQPWGDSGLTLLASGSIPPNPSELLGSNAMADLMVALRARFDMILVDSPPVLPVTDAVVLSAVADGILMVVHYGRTTRAQFTSAITALDAVDAKLIGTVLNMAPVKDIPSGYGGYRYAEEAKIPAAATKKRTQAAVTTPTPDSVRRRRATEDLPTKTESPTRN